ncbi:hypothetical protein C8R43DRAFT_525694 [Mycena crocata]|nr:hypothetical protein C8R43DRAFT_525694 [Mycena crocata]
MCPVRIPTERIRRFSTFAENGHSHNIRMLIFGRDSVGGEDFLLSSDAPNGGPRTGFRPDWRVRGSRAPPHVRKGKCRSAEAVGKGAARCCGCSRVRGCIQDDSTTSCPARWRPRVQLLSNSIKIIASIHYSYRMNLRRASTSRMFFHSCTAFMFFQLSSDAHMDDGHGSVD